MITIDTTTKIYVHCPAGLVTGGAELLHQIVDVIRRESGDAYIVYDGDAPKVVPSEYACYDIEVADSIIDNAAHVEIFPETMLNNLNKNKHTQKFIWWLSIDNFFVASRGHISLFDLWGWDKQTFLYELTRRAYRFRKSLISSPISFDKFKHISHGYQSEYAKQFLTSKGIHNLFALQDYINLDHISLSASTEREDIILYNPKKGFEFTQELIRMSPHLQWVAIQGMSREEVIALMRRSKLYVDFGNHPGKDRLPRECVMNGCCVITGKRGSARYFEDVSISDEFKYDESKSDKNEIISKVTYILNNYESMNSQFDYYRGLILKEQADFEDQVKRLFVKTKE